jgi:cytochrome c biogenesis protein CcmG/thiol:disulfide interchange protein DsbE
MKNAFVLLVLLTSSLTALAQEKTSIFPSINLKSIEGKMVNTNSFENAGNPIVVSFWATWCKPCAKELDAITEVYDDWQEETGVKVIAISIDDTRNAAKVAPYANGKDWPFEIYLDSNSDLKRALNVNAIPHTFLLNSKNEIVWQHTSYFDGDEEELFEEIKKLK